MQARLEEGHEIVTDQMPSQSGAQWRGGDFVMTAPTGGPDVYLCQACARIGHCRLGLQEETLQDGVVTTHLTCHSENEGGPGVAHGGWIAGVLDELVGHVPLLHNQLSVTGTLTVRFIKPVPIDKPLLGTARLISKEERRWHVDATLALASSGAELASAEAVMVLRDSGHFERHRQWLAEQECRGA